MTGIDSRQPDRRSKPDDDHAEVAALGGVIRPYNFSRTNTNVDANAQMMFLVPTASPVLTYHGGALLTRSSIRVHILWYGAFSPAQQAAITDFVASFSGGAAAAGAQSPSVFSWWRNIAGLYRDSSQAPAASSFKLGAVASDPSCSLMGKKLADSDLAILVSKSISTPGFLPKPSPASSSSASASAIYAVFTAQDVLVEDFCMNSCGTHSSSTVGAGAGGARVPFLWVGNPATQCTGLCAWPYAVPQFGPPRPALSAPNGEAATDGMIINLALLLAGTVTNPFESGYFQGDASAPLEAGSSCQGIYGKGSYAGYPGQLLQDKDSGVSYNAVGANNRRFLLPALWNPTTQSCQPL